MAALLGTGLERTAEFSPDGVQVEQRLRWVLARPVPRVHHL